MPHRTSFFHRGYRAYGVDPYMGPFNYYSPPVLMPPQAAMAPPNFGGAAVAAGGLPVGAPVGGPEA